MINAFGVSLTPDKCSKMLQVCVCVCVRLEGCFFVLSMCVLSLTSSLRSIDIVLLSTIFSIYITQASY